MSLNEELRIIHSRQNIPNIDIYLYNIVKKKKWDRSPFQKKQNRFPKEPRRTKRWVEDKSAQDYSFSVPAEVIRQVWCQLLTISRRETRLLREELVKNHLRGAVSLAFDSDWPECSCILWFAQISVLHGHTIYI